MSIYTLYTNVVIPGFFIILADVMEEIWKSIIGFRSCQISNFGRVRTAESIKTGRLSKKGYPRVNIGGKKIKKTFYVHRLVAEYFLKPVTGKDQVNHVDGDKKNNRVDNLEWCTGRENVDHAIKMGLRPRGVLKSGGIIKPGEAAIIRWSKLSNKELCIKFNVCRQTIWRIKNGKTQSVNYE